jgi:hypothetical protein
LVVRLVLLALVVALLLRLVVLLVAWGLLPLPFLLLDLSGRPEVQSLGHSRPSLLGHRALMQRLPSSVWIRLTN